MKILVLNGSPKGPQSVTMQYIAYWQKRFPEHEFTIIHASQQEQLFEKNESAFARVLDVIAAADFVLWAFPVYFLLVHSRYMRFIELIFERSAEHCFKGKYTAALSTSIHFYDHTAHNYIHSICDDLDMNYLGGIPAHMNDLTKPQVRASIDELFSKWEEAATSRNPTAPAFAAVLHTPFELGELVSGADSTTIVCTKGRMILTGCIALKSFLPISLFLQGL